MYKNLIYEFAVGCKYNGDIYSKTLNTTQNNRWKENCFTDENRRV
jgi:hypothetical protein